MKNTKVASRYAKALLELAIDQNKVDSVLGDMNFLLSTSREAQDFQTLIESPIVKSDKKISIFELIFEQFETVTIDFLKLVTNKRREALLPQIAEAFEALVKEHKGIVPITITSAVQLDEKTKGIILTKINGAVKGQLEVTEKIDESLIGGFVVRMGDTRIDASVLNQINNLKQRLTR